MGELILLLRTTKRLGVGRKFEGIGELPRHPAQKEPRFQRGGKLQELSIFSFAECAESQMVWDREAKKLSEI